MEQEHEDYDDGGAPPRRLPPLWVWMVILTVIAPCVPLVYVPLQHGLESIGIRILP